MNPPGVFICNFEGQDNSGKGTQFCLLLKRLNDLGYPTKGISFPRYDTPSGKMVKDYLNGRYDNAVSFSPYGASILYAWDRFCAKTDIQRWLSDGNYLITDRYALSNEAHQLAKIADPEERKRFRKWLLNMEFHPDFFGIPKPLVNIILRVNPKVTYEGSERRAVSRGEGRDGHEANFDHIRSAADAFYQLALENPQENIVVECMEGDQWLPIEIIREKIWTIVETIIKSRS